MMPAATVMNYKQSHTKDSQSLAAKTENVLVTSKNNLESCAHLKAGENVAQSVSKKKKWKWRKNKKRKPQGQLGGESGDSSGKTTGNSAVKIKPDESTGTDSVQPAKKKQKRRKKKLVKDEGRSADASEYKPVIVVKKAEDYSANWKQLKEVIVIFFSFFFS